MGLYSTIALCLCLGMITEGRNAFRAMFPEKFPPMLKNGVDPGKPLFLTPYLEKGQIDLARQLSLVGPLNGTNVKSYSGYLTVNKTYNSNLFFWFFPAQKDPMNAPVLLWLQGGPGGSSLFGLFVEHGPFFVDADTNLHPRNITWNSKYSMLYIDNPAGTGFSFTDNDAGYATNEEEVGRDLYSALTQFFQIYNEYQANDFYVTGESYAGKYVPAISYTIHMNNPGAKVKINLKGLAIGDGLIDPVTMIPKYADFMYNIGVLDESERDYFQNGTDQTVALINQGKWLDAFKVLQSLIFSDNDFFYLHSGYRDRYNFLRSQEPADYGYYGNLLAKPEVRKAIHVGDLPYNAGDKVEMHLLTDFLQSTKPWLAVLMDNYKVMIYNGQLDIIIAIPLTEAFLPTVQWSGQQQYLKAKKTVWKINKSDTEVAGFVRQVGDFYQVIVRGAGHILPHDQPERGFDMIDRFISGKPFTG
ncbi:probable serine carboxypeptidase CPVL isoform X2 [Liolophura sinensis]|uniref:probable serine carboxypeptidase CPVL isoform X2 n=1 Tax=Liolophura sinensis TaxID=3198878 RepID=UPI003159549A